MRFGCLCSLVLHGWRFPLFVCAACAGCGVGHGGLLFVVQFSGAHPFCVDITTACASAAGFPHAAHAGAGKPGSRARKARRKSATHRFYLSPGCTFDHGSLGAIPWERNLPTSIVGPTAVKVPRAHRDPCRNDGTRSEERRVGKECRYRWAGEDEKKKKKRTRER